MRKVGPYPSIAAASRAMGIHESALGGRLRRGWADCEALEIPVGPSPYRDSVKQPIYHEAWLKKQVKARALREMDLSYRVIGLQLHCSLRKAHDLVNRKTPAYL